MNKSIMNTEKGVCYICGNNKGFELHHVFGASNRKKSDKYGLTVYLCHNCHNAPPNGVHFNVENARRLKAKAQKMAMQYYKWDTEQFRMIWGRSYDTE